MHSRGGSSTAAVFGENVAMRAASRPPLFPAFLDLRGKPVVVVGGGEVAARKARSLERSGAAVTLVAPEICAALAERVRRGGIRHRAKRFEAGDPARSR